MSQEPQRTPLWMTCIIVLCMLPVLVFPLALPSMPQDELPRYMIWFYPAYVLVDGVCAWITYPQRHTVAWILLALMVLTHIGMYFLIPS